jgi:hypothetical protein
VITKTDAAERQLDTAIRLFFENRDHLSSYTLSVASREITDDVIQSRINEIYERELARVGDAQEVRLSYREELKILIKDEFYKNFRDLDRKWQNFLKHADRDPDAEMKPVTTKQVAMAIIWAIKNYTLLTQHWTTEMQTFFAWFAVAEPQLIKKSAPGSAVADKAAAEMRSNISGDPYDRDNLKTIYSGLMVTDRPLRIPAHSR